MSKNIDLRYGYDMDLEIGEQGYLEQLNGESTMLNAFFTDALHHSQRGYWLPLPSTNLWVYDQSRNNDDVTADISETSRNIAKQLVDNGLYDRIDTDVTNNGTIVTLNIQAFNDNKIVFSRKFRI